jgi:hypothetical protein
MLGKAKLEEGIAGVARLHAMVGEQVGEDAEPAQVVVSKPNHRHADRPASTVHVRRRIKRWRA